MSRVSRRPGPPLVLNGELEHERESGRWIAEVTDIPGVMVYGKTQRDALRRVQALAFEVLANRLNRGEDPLTGHPARPRPIGGIEFARQAPMAR